MLSQSGSHFWQGRTHAKQSSIRSIAWNESMSTGFSLVEVLVAIIIVSTFLMVTMQIFLSAALLRAKAAEYNEAYNWIQEDFEQVLTKSKTYEMQAQPYSIFCNSANVTDSIAANFVTDTGQGLGGSVVNLGERALGGQTFSLVRTADNAGTLEPNRLVALNYSMSRPGDPQPALQLQTKVVVYAAFNCPQAQD